MEIVCLIKDSVNDNALKELTDDVIEECTKQSKKNNLRNCIGAELDINPVDYHIDDPNFDVERFYEGSSFWVGYVPIGTKIVYGRFYCPRFKTSTNRGCYYYVDDDSYIYDFFKLIKESEIEDEFDIIWLAHSFIKKLFDKKIDAKTRYEMHKLIYKDEELLFRPLKEHGIKDFYHNGSAMCSEIALVAENLLSSLGLEIMYLEDKGHAYNIYRYYNEEEKKDELYILDYAKWVNCYNAEYKYIGSAPFIGEIEDANDDTVDEIVNEGKRIKVDDYYLLSINGTLFEVKCEEKREYGTDFALAPEKKLILKYN